MDQGRALESSDMTAAAPGSALPLTHAARLGSARPAAAPHQPPGPACSGRSTPGRAGQARPRGGDARLRPTWPRAAPRPAVPSQPGPRAGLGLRGTATRAAPRPCPSVPPSTRTPGTAKLSLLPPPADARRADVTAPGSPAPSTGPAASGRHLRCGGTGGEPGRGRRRGSR